MKTRKFDWFDTKSGTPVYSFQVYKDGKWMNVAKDSVPAFYKTEAERDQARKDFNKKPKKQQFSDELLDQIIYDLDNYATDVDPHEYGLPTYGSDFVAMRVRIRAILEGAKS